MQAGKCDEPSPDAAYYQAQGLKDLRKALAAPRYEGPAKNIVFFVGDGLGVATHTMARIYKGQTAGGSGEESSLVWEDWDYSGLIKVGRHSTLDGFYDHVGQYHPSTKGSTPYVPHSVAQGKGIIWLDHLHSTDQTL